MNSKEIIESGLLELYALGTLDGIELDMVRTALANDLLLKEELAHIEHILFLYAQVHSVMPGPIVKPLLMAKIDYLERLDNGEVPNQIQVLTEASRIEHFDPWLRREDLQLSPNFDEVQISIISEESDKVTSIVWLKTGAPPETHHSDYEKFLIVEGTCLITIGTNVHPLRAGDFLSVPLHVSHHVRVTSKVPCKIILQRVKA